VRRSCQGLQPLAWLLGVLLCGASVGARADDSAWRDLESRIQFSYYTEDMAALRHLSEAVTASDEHDKLHGYYAALLNWRLAQLAAASSPARTGVSVSQLTRRCVSDSEAALAIAPDFVEALALRATCLAQPLAGSGTHAPFSGYRARKDLERALQLAPRNPRVMLLDALNDYELPTAEGGNKERALVKLRETTNAFEVERRDAAVALPGWGAAEAWLLLARTLLEHGDPVGARDADERALLLAPQFLQARRLMSKITSG
jgi:tetratricopeptide (TPR) repeat protein